jgi:Protein of unknown function (DUF541)
MATSRRSLGVGLLLGLVVGALAAGGAALAGGGAVLARGPVAAATTPAAAIYPTGLSMVGAPSVGSGAGVAAGPATGIASTGTAIAYPYPGSPGLAPDHTIVVTGVGQANLAADGSGRATATKAALTAAVADAKAQADLVASTLSVSITGVLSVSSSVSDYGQIYAVPMMGGSTAPGAPVPAPTNGVSLPQLSVTVTVAYSIG